MDHVVSSVHHVVSSVHHGSSSHQFHHTCRLGDVLESINHVDLACATHQDAVKAVKESSGSLDIVSYQLMY